MRSLHTAVISTVCFMLVVGFSATNAAAQDAYYVAFDGSDQNPGTVESPFATLEQARNAIRESKSAEGLPDGGITVWVKGGMYPFTKTLVLTPEDAGTRNTPIVYRAMPDESDCNGSPAVSDGRIFLRSNRLLYCISQE